MVDNYIDNNDNLELWVDCIDELGEVEDKHTWRETTNQKDRSGKSMPGMPEKKTKADRANTKIPRTTTRRQRNRIVTSKSQKGFPTESKPQRQK